MKSIIEPALAVALTFAVLAILFVVIAHYSQNLYFIVAAGAFAVATYVTYPPLWLVQLANAISGKHDDPKDSK